MRVVSERQMSETEGLMWRLEREADLSSTFGALSILDRTPDVDRLRATLERALDEVPRLGWRVQPVPGNVLPPRWVDDPDFDIDHHVRRITLPSPATERELLDLATLLVADPFDRQRPLWQFWVIEGLAGSKVALLQKMHHTLTDGVGGLKLALSFLDLERTPAARHPGDEPRPRPEPPSLARGLLAAGLEVPLGALRDLRDSLSDPWVVPRHGIATARAMGELVSQLTMAGAARSPLWTARSPRRRAEVLRVPFAPIRAAAKRLGGTINTALLTAAADAAGAYHDGAGAPVDELRASMAVSTRTKSSGNNAFTLARVLLPTGAMGITERFAEVLSRTNRAADEVRGAGLLESAAGLAATLPGGLVARLARHQTGTVDFATSNVRAAPFPMYIAGARIEATYPIGPLLGVAFNLTLMSYDGSLDLGLHVDHAAVTEPGRLRQHLEASFAALADDGRPTRRPRTRRASPRRRS